MTRAWHDSSLPSQVSAAVRGSASLQDDIADEIADHLACRAEASGGDDPTASQAEAVRAFGDPDQIARELRAVHLGDLIMFQRVMVAAVVVIVIGMACSAYFSWSATQTMSTQMIKATRESSRQITELARQLTALNAQQIATRPPHLRIYCYTGPPDQPAAGYPLTVESVDPGVSASKASSLGRSFRNTYQTDPNGWIDSGPLSLGVYKLSGKVPATDTESPGATGQWTRVIRLQQQGVTKEVRLCVRPGHRHEVRLAVPPEVTWHPDMMKVVGIRFMGTSGPSILRLDAETWTGRLQRLDLSAGSTFSCLWPGEAKPYLVFANPKRGEGEDPFAGRMASLATVEVPAGDGPITLKAPGGDGPSIKGKVYDGSEDNPVAGVRVDVLHRGTRRSRGSPSVYEGGTGRESLRTDAKGRFCSLGCVSGPIALEFHLTDADGKPTVLSIPTEMSPRYHADVSYDIDVSKLSTVRISLPTPKEFLAHGVSVEAKVESRWEASSSSYVPQFRRASKGQLDIPWPAERPYSVLMLPGRYTLRVSITTRTYLGQRRSLDTRRSITLPAECRALVDVSLTTDDFIRRRSRVARRRASSRPGSGDQATTKPADLAITAAKLCKKVERFGVYEEIKPLRFPAGQPNRAILYCELENYTLLEADKAEQDRFLVRLIQDVEIFNSKGQLVYQKANANIRHTSQQPPKDFFLVQLLDLPARLPPGKYRLKVSVKDSSSGKPGERQLDFTVTPATARPAT